MQLSIPYSLAVDGARRMGWVGLALAVSAIGILTTGFLVHPGLVNPDAAPLSYTAAMAGIAACGLGLFLVQRFKAAPDALQIGLAVQVAAGLLISVAENAVPILDPIRGNSSVAVWVTVFALAVPVRFSKGLAAALATAAMGPLGLAIQVALENVPNPPVSLWLILFSPHFLMAVAAAVLGRLIYQLGTEVKAAREYGGYALVEKLGQGGMGEVWRARHHLIGRPAAVKLIRPDILATDGVDTPAAMRRFEREAAATAALRSPHTVSLYNYGITDDGLLYYVMELLEGYDLATLVKRHGPMPPARAVAILVQVCESLEEAHAAQFIHRDIKPANIQLCRMGATYDFVKVLDFGLVKRVDASETHTTAGTPAYMAPETLAGKPAGERSDIYSLGCVAYWLLTGTDVFDHSTLHPLVRAALMTAPAAPSSLCGESVPVELDSLILRCLEKDPEARPISVREVRETLERIPLTWPRGEAQRWWTKAAGALCLLAFACQAQPPEAVKLFGERKFQEAAAVLEQTVKAKPGDRSSRYLLALSWQQAGELARAEGHLTQIVRTEPKWAPGHYALARVHFFAGRFDPAIAAAKMALSLGEPEARVYHLIGSVEEERGQLEAALTAFTRANAHSGRASVLYKLGRYDEARQAAAADPSNPQAQRVAAQLNRATEAKSVASAPVVFTRVPFPFVLEHNPGPQKYLVSTMAGGLAVFDYDRDGRLDLFFTNGAALPSLRKSGDPKYCNRLYRNLGGWRFQDVTDAAGLCGDGFSIGAAAGDFDGDGWVDLFVAGAGRNLLYRNQKGRFVELPDRIADERWSVAGSWLDYDSDGRLDLFVVNYLDWTPENPKICGSPVRVYCHPKEYGGTANKLYRNLGGGRFADVSKEAGIASHIGKGMSAAAADYDGDGRPDLFVTNDSLPNFLFRNTGGRFEEVALESGVAVNDLGKPVSSMGAAFQDYDNDGRPDILITALTGETFPVFRRTNEGFVDATYPSGVGIATMRRSGWGVALADLNNDGWKDLVTANSHVTDNIALVRSEVYLEPNLLLLNGGGKFGSAVEFGPKAAHRGLTAADLDGDGRLDLVVTVLGGAAEVWRNDSNAGQWLAVEVPAGTTVRAGQQVMQAFSTVGYASSVEAPLHFGLGTAETVDLDVTFPNGSRQKVPAIRTNQKVRIFPAAAH
ncbi:MAG: tetratricopeptide repeat protein [Acidobacteria bacterium]|nr:tetratricopeptide repeat protein [Acidobacteriota bacterium]